MIIRGNTLEYWKNNAEEDYLKVPISVLKYITILEEIVNKEENTESCAGCRFYNSCGLRIDYDNVRCPDFLS